MSYRHMLIGPYWVIFEKFLYNFYKKNKKLSKKSVNF